MGRYSSDYDVPTFSDLPPWRQVAIALIIGIVLLWIFVIQPFIEWVKLNILLFSGILVIIIIILVWLYSLYQKQEAEKRMLEAKRNAERKVFEEQQRAKGLVSYTDFFGKEKWGKPEQIESWRKEDEKLTMINRVADAIRAYRPPKPLRDEYAYQMGLHGYLEHEFSGTQVEVQRGHSRPDLVIGDIAIEVKGPTDTMALQTVPDKAMRYMQKFKHLVVVLFEPQFNEGRYNEWLQGMKFKFPEVIVIRK